MRVTSVFYFLALFLLINFSVFGQGATQSILRSLSKVDTIDIVDMDSLVLRFKYVIKPRRSDSSIPNNRDSIAVLAMNEVDYQGPLSIYFNTYPKGSKFELTNVSLEDFTLVRNSFKVRPQITKTKFGGRTLIDNNTFSEGLECRFSEFKSDVILWRNELSHTVSFDNCTFKGDLILEETTLPNYLSFRFTKVDKGTIDLSSAKLDSIRYDSKKWCYIDLRDAPIEKIRFHYNNFRLYVPEILDMESFDRMSQVYERLLGHFKKMGYLTSYEHLDKEYHDFKRSQDPDAKWESHLLNFINKYWNDYGHKKSRIWLFTITFFFLFTMINWIKLGYLHSNIYSLPAIDGILKERCSNSKRVNLKWFSYPAFKNLDQALIYTAVIFFGLKLSIGNFNFRNFGGVLYISFQYVVGLVCLGYLANFVISSQVIGT